MLIRSLLKVFVLSLVISSTSALATVSPIGKWTTYDLDNTARTVVEIYQTGETLSGKVMRELHPKKGEVAEPVCASCPGDKKNQPKLGMVILWGLVPKGNKWVDGTILDTDSGKTYSCQIKDVSSDAKFLEFRAYVGMPLFGKTITWTKYE